jgi:hypothetical protein
VGDRGLSKVLVDGREAKFLLDSTQGLIHGPITFTNRPIEVDVFLCDRTSNRLAEAPASPDVLGQNSK